ncbi:MAG: hypothetical protein JWL71_4866 [Acidobacteria bacterium]|nr:hypothetical protein [Acidobacteriota bacterium]
MKKLNAIAGIVLAAAAIVVGSASAAQAEDRVDVKVPFAFIVNGEQLPAGTYDVAEMSDGPNVLIIRSADGREAVSMLTIPSSSSNEEGDPKLLFEMIDNQHVLVGIDYGDGDSRQLASNTSKADQPVVTPAHGGNW